MSVLSGYVVGAVLLLIAANTALLNERVQAELHPGTVQSSSLGWLGKSKTRVNEMRAEEDDGCTSEPFAQSCGGSSTEQPRVEDDELRTSIVLHSQRPSVCTRPRDAGL